MRTELRVDHWVPERRWDGGLSTYTVRIVPRMWLLTQRRTHRVFQNESELDVVLELDAGSSEGKGA